MHDAALFRDGRDDPTAIGYVLLAALTLAGLARWVSGLTAGAGRGGRYDLPLVDHLSWFAFLLFATVAFMALIGGVCRVVERLRPARADTSAT